MFPILWIEKTHSIIFQNQFQNLFDRLFIKSNLLLRNGF